MLGGLQSLPGSHIVPFPQPHENQNYLPGQVLQSQVEGPVCQQHSQGPVRQPQQPVHAARHDLVKQGISRLCTWAGVPFEVEVFNMFSALIPQAELARIEKERQRQAMVPDFKITLNSGEQSAPVLHELKVISSSRSRYSPIHKDRGVDKRASQLNKEYQDKAKNADRLHGGLQPGVVGKVEAKLHCVRQLGGGE